MKHKKQKTETFKWYQIIKLINPYKIYFVLLKSQTSIKKKIINICCHYDHNRTSHNDINISNTSMIKRKAKFEKLIFKNNFKLNSTYIYF